MITIQKVVTRNFIIDIIAKIQNFFGTNLTPYEKMIEKGIEQITNELKIKKVKLAWYRLQISELNNGAIIIMLYGDEK